MSLSLVAVLCVLCSYSVVGLRGRSRAFTVRAGPVGGKGVGSQINKVRAVLLCGAKLRHI